MHATKIRREKLTISMPRKQETVVSPVSNGEIVLDTETLFNGTRELKINHNSEIYRLSITKLGKLILTK